MELKKNMQTNISVVSKNGQIQARLNYKDQDMPESISVEASGKDIEDVVGDLYTKMLDSIDSLLAEPEEPEELSDAEYIKKLETQIEQLMKENAMLQKKKEVTEKSPWYTYNTVKIPSSSLNFNKKFENIWKEIFE